MPDFQAFVIPDEISEFGEGLPTTLVTEGNYLLELDSIVAGQNRTTGEAFMSFRTRIIDGPIGMEPQGAGLPIWSMNVFNAERVWATGQMLNAIGFNYNSLKQVKVPTYEFFKQLCAGISQACKGRRFGVTLTEYTGGRVKVSQIQRPFPAVEFEAQKAAAGAQRPAQPPTAPNGAATDTEIQNQLGALLSSSTTV